MKTLTWHDGDGEARTYQLAAEGWDRWPDNDKRALADPGSIWIERQAEIGLPLRLLAALLSSGELIEIRTGWQTLNDNCYWHLRDGISQDATAAQRATICDMIAGCGPAVFGLALGQDHIPGADVQRAAGGFRASEIEAAAGHQVFFA